MKSIFKTKDQYFTMKAQWALSSKSPKCKSTLEPCDEWINEDVSVCTGTIRRAGWMTAKHHILYNLLRNKPVANGFTPITNPKKKVSKLDVVTNELNTLLFIQRRAKLMTKPARFWKNKAPEHTTYDKYQVRLVESLLAPFGDTLTVEQFAQMVIPLTWSIEGVDAKQCLPV